MGRYRRKGDRHIRRPAKMNSWDITNRENDGRLFSDDAVIKTAKLSEIYEKLKNIRTLQNTK